VTSLDTTRLPVLDAAGRALLFTDARTANSFSDEPVSDDELRDIWELARWAPTSANVQPLRVVYVRTPEGKARLLPHLYDTNRPKSEAAPVVAVLAADLAFHELIHKTFPIRPEMKERFNDEAVRTEAALYNATLQAGYFILAVRAAGLAAGPMLGFDKGGVDAEFFAGTSLASTLVVNIGHPGENPWFPRLPRLELDEIITWA
jgi:3-hydroxypropanoate dehydrogenase